MITGYIWAAMWFILAAYLLFTAIREERMLLMVVPFFIFLGGWQLADELLEADLMAPPYVWIYRGIAVAALIVYGIRFYIYKKKGK